eukprot:TRINITY_DN949_c0_g1_i1.p1 TRINITY_DN949_c0_g1~~TRINITY_DN949_c0_g1_i1.p1  ORF type:complete len:246 (+),score=61.00 TRINITY_DN949_c0_g1_i1:53-739(+)
MSVILHARLPSLEATDVRAEASETIMAVRHRIELSTGINTKWFVLMFDGKVLDDGDTVGTCPFQDGSEVLVVLSREHEARGKLVELEWDKKSPEDLVRNIRRLHSITNSDRVEIDKELASVIGAMAEVGLCNDGKVMAEAFLLASCRGLVKCLAAMLDNGVVGIDDQPEGYNSHTALLHAAYYNKKESAALLLKYYANRDLRSRFGQTALDYARAKGHQDIVALLEAA